jgi:Rrf2 family nitric oxide-sensitive transcriptional repressor
MKLTKSLDIALMTLAELAASKKQTSAAQLARTLAAPRNHIAKVIQLLARGGYVRTLRGKGGGIRLAKAPAAVTLKEIIDLVEGPVYLMVCTVDPAACPLSPRCRLEQTFKRAQESMMKVFRTTTLADVLPLKKGRANRRGETLKGTWKEASHETDRNPQE